MFSPVRSRPPRLPLALSRPHPRLLSTTAPVRDLVGPSDPLSNLRPVIYTDSPSPSPSPPAVRRHPYSLTEFRLRTKAPGAREAGSGAELALAYRWRLQKQQLDAFNHAFWADSNARFDASLASAVAGTAPSSPEHERALNAFYGRWVHAEAARQEEYNREWRRRSVEEIKLAFRVSWQRLLARFTAA